MADIRGFQQSTTQTGAAVDQGLRAYMLKVYNYMAAGLAITALAAYITFSAAVGADGQLTAFGQTVMMGPMRWVLVFAPLGLVMLLSWRSPTHFLGLCRLGGHELFNLRSGLHWRFHRAGFLDYSRRFWCAQPLWLYHQA
jgi:hypothetical protein